LTKCKSCVRRVEKMDKDVENACETGRAIKNSYCRVVLDCLLCCFFFINFHYGIDIKIKLNKESI
jgi:hypothetical protein